MAAGFGVALFPAQIGRLAMPSLRFVPLDKSTPKYQLCVAWRKDNRSPALERFLVTARDVVGAAGPRAGGRNFNAKARRRGDSQRRRKRKRKAESVTLFPLLPHPRLSLRVSASLRLCVKISGPSKQHACLTARGSRSSFATGPARRDAPDRNYRARLPSSAGFARARSS